MKFLHIHTFCTIWVLKILFEDKENIVKMLFDQRSDMIDVKNDNGRTSLSLVVEAKGKFYAWSRKFEISRENVKLLNIRFIFSIEK